MALSDLVAKIVIRLEDLTASGAGSVRRNVDSISESAQRATQAVKGFISTYVGAQLFEKTIALADSWTEINSRLKLATISNEEFVKSQKTLFQVAQDTRSEFSAVASLYSRTAKSLRDLGFTQNDSFSLTRLTAEAFKISGASAAESAAGIQQFAQALGSGVVRGDEFNSMMEAAPRLMQALADGLGVPIGKLREMAEAGELTAGKVVKALLSQKGVLESEYAKIPATVAGAMTQAGNALLRYVGTVNESSGSTGKLVTAIQAVADNIPQLVSTAVVLAEAYGVKMASAFATATVETLRNRAAQALAAEAAQQAALAAQQEAAAQLQAAEAHTVAIQAQVAQSAATVEQLALDAALARGTELQAVMELRLAEARAAHTRLIQAESEALLNLRAAQEAVAATAPQAAAATGLLTRAVGALNWVLGAFIAFEIGRTIGEWLNKFESMRLAGSYIAQAWVRAGEGVRYFYEMGRAIFTDDTFADVQRRSEERRKAIDKEFADMREVGKQTGYQFGEAAGGADQLNNALGNMPGAVNGANAALQTNQQSVKQLADVYKDAGTAMETAQAATLDALDRGYQQRIASIDRTTKDENAAERKQADATVAYFGDRIAAVERYTKDRLALIDQASAEEIKAAGKSKEQIAQIEQGALKDREKINEQRIAEYGKAIEALNNLEAQHLDKAKDYAKQRVDVEKQMRQGLQQIEQAGQGPASPTGVDTGFAARSQQLLEAQKSARSGDTEAAKQQYQAIADAAKQAAIDEQKALQEGTGSIIDKNAYVAQYQQALRELGALYGNQEKAETQSATKAREAAQQAQQDLSKLESTLKSIQAEIAKGFDIQIKTNAGQVADQLQGKAPGAPASQADAKAQQQVQDQQQLAGAMGNTQQAADQLGQAQANVQPVDTLSSQSSLQQLQAALQQAQTDMSAMTAAGQGMTDPAVAAQQNLITWLQQVIAQIEAVPRQIDVAVNYTSTGDVPAYRPADIQKYKTGSNSYSDGTDAGPAPGFADGVRLPGFGGGDRRPALLEDGEGVLNKHALKALDAAFGAGFFDSLNAGKSPMELLHLKFGARRLSAGGRMFGATMPEFNWSSRSIPTQTQGAASNGAPASDLAPININGRRTGMYAKRSDAGTLEKQFAEMAAIYGK